MPSDPDRFLVESERLRSVFQQLPLTSCVTVLNAALTAAVLAPVTNHAKLLAWFGAIAAVSALRLALQRAFLRHRPSDQSVRRWAAISIGGALASGSLWGLGLSAMFPAAETLQLFLAFVIGGMCAGATTVSAAHFPTVMAFILPASLPLAVDLLATEGVSHTVSALMVVIFAISLSLTSLRSHYGFGQRLRLHYALKRQRLKLTAANERLRAEAEERRTIEATLHQAQKVQALGQLASGIAHDFNNILQAVEGALTLIERRPEDLEKTRRLTRMAIDATKRGSSITQRLLSFARRDALRTEVLPTAEVLTNIREVLAHTLGSTITVRSIVPPDIPPLMADRGQLETVLLNLGTNARDAMPKGGTLALSAETEHVIEDDRHPAGLTAGAYVRLSVTDTGTGMDAATLAQVTDAFFTTKPPGQGTGLGLPMAKTFAEQLGGAMSIVSTPGAGTTVILWLPQAADPIMPRASDETSGRITLDASAHILLVDDDAMVRETLAAQLEDFGFDLLVASGGAEAIALLEAGETVDALVSDLSMPEMDGVTTIQQARTLRPRLPCFLLTGYVGERAALSAGDAFTLVRKPISAPTLAARIEAGLEAARK